MSKGRAVAGKSHQPRILPWQVTVISIPVSAAFDLFCACPGKQTLAPGVVIGADLTYWAAATRFAGAIVAREQFLPTLEIKGDSPRARWEPVLAPADAARVAQLAHAMPHVCRALASPKGSMRTKARRRGPSAPPDIPAHLVLTALLAELVDYMVRSASAQDAGGIGGRTASSSRPKNAAGFASVHDQWFAALRSDAGTMSGSEVELARLSDQVREWQRPVSVTRSTPFRLCFRLEEPEEPEQAGWQAEETAELPLPERHNRIDDRSTSANGQTEPDATPPAPWRVRYLLQASDDPSLLVPVPEAWSANGHHPSVLKRGSFKPREYLLSSLGQAAKLNSQIEESQRSPAPWGYDLDSAGAYRFLSEQAWLLEQSGFGVLLPAWWTRKGTKLRLSSRARVQSPAMKSSGGISLDDIVTFDWEVLLGGQELSLEELEMLARLKSPLVRLRGQWVQISGAEIEAALAFWKNRSRGRAKVREIMQMALGAESAPGELPLEEVAATGWIGELLSQLEGGRPFEEQPPPDEFNGVLRPYQVRGYSWLGFLKRWGLGACLADDMGLGKTPQTLALIQREWITNGKRPTLVICPMSVVGNWQKEATRFTPDLPVMIHHGMARTKGPAFKKAAGKHALVLSSFSLLHRDLDLLKQVDWAGIVLDEAQNIKNP
ncbi:MAG TPA: DEAD/DEAH box helicase, partial [Blastocatellia bacterium]|nr:DEAD/DEAH box helicase [Blastocatellia bacterium]